MVDKDPKPRFGKREDRGVLTPQYEDVRPPIMQVSHKPVDDYRREGIVRRYFSDQARHINESENSPLTKKLKGKILRKTLLISVVGAVLPIAVTVLIPSYLWLIPGAAIMAGGTYWGIRKMTRLYNIQTHRLLLRMLRTAKETSEDYHSN